MWWYIHEDVIELHINIDNNYEDGDDDDADVFDFRKVRVDVVEPDINAGDYADSDDENSMVWDFMVSAKILKDSMIIPTTQESASFNY